MTVYGKIGADGGPSNDGIISDWITRLDMWRESYLIGRWAVIIDNNANQCWGKFVPDKTETVEFKIDGISLMKGYTDDSLPEGLPHGSDRQLIRVTGRDYSRDLALLFHTEDYSDGLSQIDNIIDDALTDTSSEITLAGAATPTEPYVADRTYLKDLVRDLTERNDYLYYVQDNKAMNLFAIGSAPASGVTLKSVAAASDNNVLRLYPIGEKRGFGIWNYIHVKGDSLKDHWTDEANRTDWTAGAGVTIANETTHVLYGLTSFEVSRAGVGIYTFYIDFPRFDQATLDFSNIGEENCYFYVFNNSINVSFRLRPRLEDSNGTIIEYYSFPPVAGDPGYTDELPYRYIKVSFPVGIDLPIKAALTNGYWWYIAGAAFDWSDIVKLHFTSVANFAAGNMKFDGLTMPLEILSIEEDAASQASYGKRMLPLSRPDLTTQAELDQYALNMKNHLKDPMETVKALIIGNTNIQYAGETVSVNVPGISTVTYRIQRLHHMYGENVHPNYTHVTELDLIKQTNEPYYQALRTYDQQRADQLRNMERLNILERGIKRQYGVW